MILTKYKNSLNNYKIVLTDWNPVGSERTQYTSPNTSYRIKKNNNNPK